MCDQQSLRSACTYAQSDQSLCLSLEYSMSVKQLAEHHLTFLSLKGGSKGSSESTLEKYHIVGSHMSQLIMEFRPQEMSTPGFTIMKEGSDLFTIFGYSLFLISMCPNCKLMSPEHFFPS